MSHTSTSILPFLAAVIIATVAPSLGVPQDNRKHPWNEIILLKTRKAELPRVVGRPLLENGYVSVYKAEFGKVVVWFAGIKARDGEVCDWKVPLDTVLSFYVSFREGVSIS